ncbi:hypothetical protein L1049_015496 [Liquidambar formosana]|uniref:Myb/SANT-like domain-containing protein n=1 Tax=Liquidambar formosana TaxID=63359 RepID=A0AAP0S3R5_LIQFO
MDSQSKLHEPKQERLRTRWTSSQDKIFADLVLEQVQLGNRSNNVFDQKAWKHIREQFNAQTGLNFNKKQLRKHLDVLRMRYYNLKSVFEQSSFNLDQSSHMVMPDYELWGDLLEEHPKRETLKIKDCPIYDQLCEIFTESGSDGRYAQSSHYKGLEKKTTGSENPGLRSCPKSASVRVGEGPAGSTMLVQDNASSRVAGLNMKLANGQKKPPSEMPSTPQHLIRNQDRLHEAIAEAMLEMLSASKVRAVATTQHDDQFSISNCVKALDDIQGIDQSVYFAALDLFDNSIQREIFMSLKHEKRLGWLQGKFKNFSTSSVV